MHWILRPEERREDFFRGVHCALKPDGVFCFEMGGMGNVAEVWSRLSEVLRMVIATIEARSSLPNSNDEDVLTLSSSDARSSLECRRKTCRFRESKTSRPVVLPGRNLDEEHVGRESGRIQSRED